MAAYTGEAVGRFSSSGVIWRGAIFYTDHFIVRIRLNYRLKVCYCSLLVTKTIDKVMTGEIQIKDLVYLRC